MDDKDLKNVCRICLQSGATIPIFETNGINSIQLKLASCINEKVEDTEEYPKNICYTCDNTLDMVCNFINKFRESSNILKNGLLFIKKEESIEYLDNDVSMDNVDLEDFKSEPEDDEKTLAELVKPANVKLKKLKSEKRSVKFVKKKRKKPSDNETNNIASAILEGDFSWTGKKWCYKIGQCTISKKATKNKVSSETDKAKYVHRKPKEQAPKVKVKDKLCDLCGEVFPTQDKLSTHQRNYHFKCPVKCPMCPKTLVSQYYLKRHMHRKHIENAKDFPCPTCGKAFAFKGELKTHIRNVHNKHLKPKKIFACKLCDKTYLCQKSVIVHERSVHTGQRPAECTICGSSFYHIDYLREHMRLHTGETPFKCPICGRGYAQRCNMKSHLRIHRMSELDAATLSKLRPNYIKLLKENRNK